MIGRNLVFSERSSDLSGCREAAGSRPPVALLTQTGKQRWRDRFRYQAWPRMGEVPRADDLRTGVITMTGAGASRSGGLARGWLVPV